jgi:hypothetical protein
MRFNLFDKGSTAPSSLPAARPRLSNRRLSTSCESFFPAISELKIENHFFSVYVPREIEGPGLLRVNRGDLVFILNEKCDKPDRFMAINKTGEGEILISYLGLDLHSPNIYLETMDVLVQHPSLFCSVLNSKYFKKEERLKELFELLCARRVLPSALKALFELEFKASLASKDQNAFLRRESESIKLVSFILNSSEGLNKFRNVFIKSLILEVRSIKKREPAAKKILRIVTWCIEHFSTLRDDQFPVELIMLLSTLKKVIDKQGMSEKCCPLLGSIFFLRFIVPALMSSAKFSKNCLKKLVDPVKISQALQMISSQSDPEPGSQRYETFSSVFEEIKGLYKPVATLLNKMASLPIAEMSIDQKPLVRLAASFYGLVAGEIKTTDEAELAALKKLRARLGPVLEYPLLEKDKIPIQRRIDEISTFITTYQDKPRPTNTAGL